MSTTCPNCGKPVPSTALKGLCPECLFKMGAAVATETAGGPRQPGITTNPPSSPQVEDIARRFPQLEVLGCLGRGGMGVVYKARQPRLDRWVALKILAPEKEKDSQFAERFTREAQALARLNHSHIVAVYDFGEADGLYYLLMEYVDGLSLRDLLGHGKLTPAEALAIVPKICEALQYAHEQGIVHRDIKPENILLNQQGQVKIADFGIAKIIGLSSKESPALTGAADRVGTPHYMAPEQVAEPRAVDHRADIYSLGVVFYELLTGDLPLGKFAPPSQKAPMDARLDEVVLHALEEKPEQRYQHAGEVRNDVETIAGTPAPPDSSRGAPSGPVSGRPRLSALAVLGAGWISLFLSTVLLVILVGQTPLGDAILRPRRGIGIPMMILVGLAYAAPFGATMLGWIAVVRIRRWPGWLYGMGLALLDGMWFPLLFLDALIGLGWWLFLNQATPAHWWVAAEFDPTRSYPLSGILAWCGLLTFLTSLVVDGALVWWVVRWAYKPRRRGVGAVPVADASRRPPPFWSRDRVRGTLGWAGVAMLTGVLLWAIFWRVPWGPWTEGWRVRARLATRMGTSSARLAPNQAPVIRIDVRRRGTPETANHTLERSLLVVDGKPYRLRNLGEPEWIDFEFHDGSDEEKFLTFTCWGNKVQVWRTTSTRRRTGMPGADEFLTCVDESGAPGKEGRSFVPWSQGKHRIQVLFNVAHNSQAPERLVPSNTVEFTVAGAPKPVSAE